MTMHSTLWTTETATILGTERPLRGDPQPGLTVTRIADVLISLIALVFLAPLMIAVALLVTATDAGPVIFGHRRVGFGGRAFACLKFRTMVVDADARLNALLAADPAARAEWEATRKLRHDPRVTPLGRFLRRSSIDELPQLFNILRGEMSLIGPRPIVAAEVGHYGRYIKAYYTVRPGVTGLWQVTGRGEASYRRRVVLDLAYIRSRSIRLDLSILFLTVPRVLFGAGSY